MPPIPSSLSSPPQLSSGMATTTTTTAATTEDDERRGKPCFLVTGFGKFPGVPANPTEVLVNHISKNAASSSPHSSNYRVSSCSVLKVSARTVAEHIRQRVAEEQGDQQSAVVLVHFGVDVCARGFKLEKRAVNEANFRLPDEDGYQPRCTPIAPDPIEHFIETKVDVESLVSELREIDGFDVQVSHDAGRYVCNYTYFSSLKAVEKKGSGCYSLFVHVPSFHAIDAQTQVRFVFKLLDRLALGLGQA